MTEVLIVEDKKETRELLSCMVHEIDPRADVFAVGSEDEAYPIAMKKSIDVFLVDIILHPRKTGDQAGAVFAQNIRNVQKYLFTPIIFITSLYDTKLTMFSTVQCYSFVEKPFNIEKTKNIIANAMRYHTTEIGERSYVFHTEGLVSAVPLDDIIYIESQKNNLHMHTTKDDIIITYKSCKKILEELDSDNFVKCNRATIVNMQYIERIDSPGRYIYLKGCEDVLEIGSILKKSFMENFAAKKAVYQRNNIV